MRAPDNDVATSSSQKSKSKTRPILILVALAAIAAGAFYWFRHGDDSSRAATRAPPRIPVSVATSSRQDVPIRVSGLGTVQALNTVPIHSQVDGKIIEIAFTEGAHVKKDAVLARIDPRPFQAVLDQAVAKKGQDEANLISAEKDLTRGKTLVAKSFETQQNVDQQQAKVDALKAGIAADRAAIEAAQTQLDYTTITAPIDGRVGIRQVDLGRIIHANDQMPLVVLTQTQPATVIFTLPESMLEPLRAAMAKGPVQVGAYDQDNVAQLGTGQVLLIDAIIDQATATIRVKAVFPNEDERLWPGAFVNARVLMETQRNVVAIPSAAVQRSQKGLFAWVVGDNNTVSMRPVKVGPPTDDVTIITAGLQEGERVVTEGYYKLQPNSVINITAPSTASAAPANEQASAAPTRSAP
jgi:membrane fusion protein, multidrug efflux system